MDAIEEDHKQAIANLEGEIVQIFKNKPDFETQREKWDIWANEYFPLCKRLKLLKITGTKVSIGRVIQPPILLIGYTINVEFIPYEGESWTFIGLHDKENEWTLHDEKVHKVFMKYILILSEAWEGFAFCMKETRFRKMKDWDYAEVMLPYVIEVRPEGFYITKYTIMDKSKKGTVSMNCEYLLDRRKIRAVNLGIESK